MAVLAPWDAMNLENTNVTGSMEQAHVLDIESTSEQLSAVMVQKKYEQDLPDDISIKHSHLQHDPAYLAAKECLELTSLMYRKLPAELRDLVYRFVCIEDQPIPVGPYFHFRPYSHNDDGTSTDGLAYALSKDRVRIDHSERPDSVMLMPNSHVFSTSHMVEEVIVELQEMYFTTNTFSVCNVENGIACFLMERNTESKSTMPDAPNVGICNSPLGKKHRVVKAIDFVRKLQIRIKYEHFYSARALGLFSNECKLLRTSRENLSVLQNLPQQEHPLEIEFIVMTALKPQRNMSAWPATDMQDERRCFINLLQALRNTFYALIHDRGDSVITITHHDETVSPFPRNITALWSLTKEQWEYEKLANHHKPTWVADFYLTPMGFNGGEAYGGFRGEEEEALLRERWGIQDVFRDKAPKWPIKEGRYWPIGKEAPDWR